MWDITPLLGGIYSINLVGMSTLTDDLLCQIEAFLGRHPEMTATKMGIAAVNDGHVVRRLRSGQSITLRTADRLCAYMADYTATQTGERARETA